MYRSGPPPLNAPHNASNSHFASINGEFFNGDPRPRTAATRPLNTLATEKTLEQYLNGDLKPITCRLLYDDHFACREMTRERDGSSGWPQTVFGSESTAFTNTGFLPKMKKHSSSPQSMSVKESNALKIQNMPTRVAAIDV